VVDRVQPLKIESPDTGGDSTDQFPTEVDPQHDHLEAAGLVLNDASHRDETTRVWRDGDSMRFADGQNSDNPTLSDLRAGSGSLPVPTRAGQILYAFTTSAFERGRIVVDENYQVVCDDNFEVVVGEP
jgi:hypothetical protein